MAGKVNGVWCQGSRAGLDTRDASGSSTKQRSRCEGSVFVGPCLRGVIGPGGSTAMICPIVRCRRTRWWWRAVSCHDGVARMLGSTGRS